MRVDFRAVDDLIKGATCSAALILLPNMVDRSAAQLSLVVTFSDRHAERAQDVVRGQGMKMEKFGSEK